LFVAIHLKSIHTSTYYTIAFHCLSVTYIENNSRKQRPRKTKIGKQVANFTRDTDITFDVKGSKVKVTRPLYSSRLVVDKQRVARQCILCLDTPSSYCTLVTPLPRKSCRLRGQRYHITKAAGVMGRSVLPQMTYCVFVGFTLPVVAVRSTGHGSGVTRNIHTYCV